MVLVEARTGKRWAVVTGANRDRLVPCPDPPVHLRWPLETGIAGVKPSVDDLQVNRRQAGGVGRKGRTAVHPVAGHRGAVEETVCGGAMRGRPDGGSGREGSWTQRVVVRTGARPCAPTMLPGMGARRWGARIGLAGAARRDRAMGAGAAWPSGCPVGARMTAGGGYRRTNLLKLLCSPPAVSA